MKKSLLALLLVLVSFCSCDKIDQPKLDFDIEYREDLYGPAPTFGPATSTLKNAFIEDFTGHKCGFCPDAAVLAEELYEAYPNRISLLAIHAGALAEPIPNSEYAADWTSADGDVLWNQLDFQFNPAGRVNRIGGPGEFLNPTIWEEKTLTELNSPSKVNLQISANYGVEGNHVNVHVNGQFSSSVDNPTNVTIYIAESKLTGYQFWYDNDPENVPDYEFNHLLRGSITGPLGLNFTQSAAVAGSEVQVDYSFKWNPEWVAENCSLVAIVTDRTTGEVLNSIEAKF